MLLSNIGGNFKNQTLNSCCWFLKHVSFSVQHMGKPVIITAGWNRKIIVYNDDAETERVQVAGRQKWKGGQLHSGNEYVTNSISPDF